MLRRAMTLLEVTVVLVVLGVLTGAAGVGFNAVYHKVVSGQSRDALAALGSTELGYAQSRGSFASAEVLTGISTAPGAVFVDGTPVAERNHFSVRMAGDDAFLTTVDSRGNCLNLKVSKGGTTQELPTTTPSDQGCAASGL